MLLLKGFEFTDSVDTSKCPCKIIVREKRRMQESVHALAADINQSAGASIRIRSQQNVANSRCSKFIAFPPSKVHSTTKEGSSFTFVHGEEREFPNPEAQRVSAV